MISAIKYLPLLISSVVFMASTLYKILAPELKLTYIFRDFIIFFILYYVTKTLLDNVERIFKNYWKIL